jgi:hypothetical protein
VRGKQEAEHATYTHTKAQAQRDTGGIAIIIIMKKWWWDWREARGS